MSYLTRERETRIDTYWEPMISVTWLLLLFIFIFISLFLFRSCGYDFCWCCRIYTLRFFAVCISVPYFTFYNKSTFIQFKLRHTIRTNFHRGTHKQTNRKNGNSNSKRNIIYPLDRHSDVYMYNSNYTYAVCAFLVHIPILALCVWLHVQAFHSVYTLLSSALLIAHSLFLCVYNFLCLCSFHHHHHHPPPPLPCIYHICIYTYTHIVWVAWSRKTFISIAYWWYLFFSHFLVVAWIGFICVFFD